MDLARRRQTLGPHVSAALPILWKSLARKGWSHSDLARAIGLTTGHTTHLLYGDRGIGLEPALAIERIFPKVKPVLWTKACPPNWRPHAYESLRPRFDATGTDGE